MIWGCKIAFSSTWISDLFCPLGRNGNAEFSGVPYKCFRGPPQRERRTIEIGDGTGQYFQLFVVLGCPGKMLIPPWPGRGGSENAFGLFVTCHCDKSNRVPAIGPSIPPVWHFVWGSRHVCDWRLSRLAANAGNRSFLTRSGHRSVKFAATHNTVTCAEAFLFFVGSA